MMNEGKNRLRVATYNIHKCKGIDGKVRPGRVAEVLNEIDADVIALQEVWCFASDDPEHDQARFLAEKLQMYLCLGHIRYHRGGLYGNIILSRTPAIFCQNYDISVQGREQRGCLRADFEWKTGQLLHVFNVHLGTNYLERRHQARKLINRAILQNDELRGTRVVLGDFNEWVAGLTTKLLSRHFRSVGPVKFLRRSRTFPVYFPLLALDYIYYDASLELEQLTIHRSRRAMAASDHLPLVADLTLHSPAVI